MNWPGKEWDIGGAKELGIDPKLLGEAQQFFLEKAGEKPHRVVIVRNGLIAAEWSRGVKADERLGLASAAKSVYSNILGILVSEGAIPSADVRLADLYPEALDIGEGEGPKEGRYVFEKDRDITLRQLISNTSGYMKPGEAPGTMFHYQTFGMNVLTHALAKALELWDWRKPGESPGLRPVFREKLEIPLGMRWDYYRYNFPNLPEEKLGIYGYYEGIKCTAREMARLGLLWVRKGQWGDRQIVPRDWMEESIRVSPDIRSHAPESDWVYGYGFWTNESGRQWESLPKDSFGASGAGGHHIWCWPEADTVVVQSPGVFSDQKDEVNQGFLSRVVSSAG